jgi:hypothetical protein
MKDPIQITIGTRTYCRREFGWIGPDLRAPGLLTWLQLEWLARSSRTK